MEGGALPGAGWSDDDTLPLRAVGEAEPTDFLDRVLAARAAALRCLRWFQALEHEAGMRGRAGDGPDRDGFASAG